jgi:hypothetical protein
VASALVVVDAHACRMSLIYISVLYRMMVIGTAVYRRTMAIGNADATDDDAVCGSCAVHDADIWSSFSFSCLIASAFSWDNRLCALTESKIHSLYEETHAQSSNILHCHDQTSCSHKKKTALYTMSQ